VFLITFYFYSIQVCFLTRPMFRVATSWKVLDFFCCFGKSLNFVYKSWKVLENIWEVFRASPRQPSEATYPMSCKRWLEGTWALAGGAAPLDFCTDNAEEGCFVILFFLFPPPKNFFLPMPLREYFNRHQWHSHGFCGKCDVLFSSFIWILQNLYFIYLI